MPTQVQFRRGTTTQNNSFTGAVGELSVDVRIFRALFLHLRKRRVIALERISTLCVFGSLGCGSHVLFGGVSGNAYPRVENAGQEIGGKVHDHD